MFFRKIWKYLTFQKQHEEGVENNTNLKLMHGINRITIMVFLLGLLSLLIRWMLKK